MIDDLFIPPKKQSVMMKVDDSWLVDKEYMKDKILITPAGIFDGVHLIPTSADVVLITVEEAQKRYGLGRNTVYNIIRADVDCKLHLAVGDNGRKVMIKREAFDAYIMNAKQI